MWPKRWIAVLLALTLQPLAFVYLARWRLALLWFGVLLLGIIAAHALVAEREIRDAIPGVFVLLCIAHVVWLTSRKRLAQYAAGHARPAYTRWYSLLLVPLIALLIWGAVRIFVADLYRVPASSMAPTLPVGKTIWVEKWGWGNYGVLDWKLLKTKNSATVRRGDIVVFELPTDPAKLFVMRVVGLPADRLEVTDNLLTLNGTRVTEPTGQTLYMPNRAAALRVFSEALDGRSYQVVFDPDARNTRPAAVTVPHDQYFVLGDHRDNALDSRYWGFVPRDKLVGRVLGQAAANNR